MSLPPVSFPTRIQVLNFFQHEFAVMQPAFSLCEIPLPTFINTIVNEIAAAKAVPRDLSLLAVLSSIAAADRGHSRIITSDGAINSLSLILYVAAESGCGKSRALEVPLGILNEWEQDKEVEITTKNRNRELMNRAIEKRIQFMLQSFVRNGDPAEFHDINKLMEAKKQLLRMPALLLNDVSAAAYAQHLVEHGWAIRLESDGIPLPKGTMRMMTKAWSGEASSRKRISSPGGFIRDPFIVDTVFTQPQFFCQHLSEVEYQESGLMARTLPYRQLGGTSMTAYPRHVNESIYAAFKDKLFELLDASEPDEIGNRKHHIITVSVDAEQLLTKCAQGWKEYAKYSGPLYRVRDFVNRMFQHTLRIAGCIYLAEHSVESDEPISISIMEFAINMVEVFLSHVLRWTIKDYEDVNAECCRAIMVHILEKNFNIVLERELKQALRRRFNASDISVALYYLVAQNHLYEYNPFSFTNGIKAKAGRPHGREFSNPYYDPNGFSF